MTADIVLVCNYRGRGGAQNNAARLASAFARRGYGTRLVFLCEREPESEFPHAGSVYVLYARKPAGLLEWIRLFVACRKALRAWQPLAVFGFNPLANVFASLGVRRSTRMVGTVRNPVWAEAGAAGSSAERTQSRAGGMLDLVLGSTPAYRAIVAVSEAVERSCARYPSAYRGKITVVYNATPVLREVTETKEECRRRLGLPEGIRLLGMLGRLHPQKNVLFAVDVLSRIPDEDIHLVLAGDGPERETITKAIARHGLERRVHLIGQVEGERITRVYRAIDLLLFPSLYEGFGLVQIEAMSQGCPVIASDLPIMREVGREATLRLPLESETWARTASALLRDAPALAAQAALGLERAAFFQDEDRMVDGYLLAAGLPRTRTGLAF